MTGARHLVVVEAYDGVLELISAEPDERASARALGLPVAEIARKLGARITVLTWDDWLRYEAAPGSFFDWIPFPATRALTAPGPAPAEEPSEGVTYRPIPARDPGHGELLVHRSPSPMMYGLLAESDPLFLLSYSLHQCLENLLAEDPFQAVLVPMWGGSGYQAQMIRATGGSRLSEVSFGTVVTGTSTQRHGTNGEGVWTRPAITRRQMEDVSLALADEAFVFGPRGARVARLGRLSVAAAPVPAARRLSAPALERMEKATSARSGGEAPVFFLQEPLDTASGVLIALDAAALLWRSGHPFRSPIMCDGPPVRFAPMKPREFSEYWSSRGFVREMVRNGNWKWTNAEGIPAGGFPVRLYPSYFEHLPSPWIGAAAGALPIMSAAATEGVAPGYDFPAEILVGEDLSPERLSAVIEALSNRPGSELEELRKQTGSGIVAAHKSAARADAFEAMVQTLDRLLSRNSNGPPLDQVARMFLDRTKSLGELAARNADPVPSTEPATLTVVVVCYNMGALVTETMETVWRSERIPDEVILVDDGSDDPATLAELASMESGGRELGLPLRVLRQKNRGLAGARNAGLKEATGTFISFLDGDDLIEPQFYRLALDLALRYPEIGGVAAWAFCFGDGVPVGFWNAPQPEFPLLLVENTVIVPCLARTRLLRDLGGYDETQRYNYEDWELSVRMLAEGYPIVTIPRYLERYRMRANSLYRSMSDVQNQGMREIMLSRHRKTAARFPIEVAMQLEHRLMQRVYARPSSPVATEAKKLARKLREIIATATRRLGWDPGEARRKP